MRNGFMRATEDYHYNPKSHTTQLFSRGVFSVSHSQSATLHCDAALTESLMGGKAASFGNISDNSGRGPADHMELGSQYFVIPSAMGNQRASFARYTCRRTFLSPKC